jgi:hypothetical protein
VTRQSKRDPELTSIKAIGSCAAELGSKTWITNTQNGTADVLSGTACWLWQRKRWFSLSLGLPVFRDFFEGGEIILLGFKHVGPRD